LVLLSSELDLPPLARFLIHLLLIIDSRGIFFVHTLLHKRFGIKLLSHLDTEFQVFADE
jgi:hypothetical protein